ncbi:MAG: signal peptidase II [Clostridiales bacterium]|nr:signal peptidase II [Clostridiales bacterium]
MLIVVFAIIVFAVGADQLTKYLIFGHDMPFIRGFIRFESVENRGMVWGMMNGVNGFMIVISIVTAVVIAALIFLLVKYSRRMSPIIAIAFAAVTGGAIGNLIDRVFLGFVRDFICTEFISFPVFNVADCFVTCGAILLAVMLLFTKQGRDFFAELFPEEKKKSPVNEEKPEAEA